MEGTTAISTSPDRGGEVSSLVGQVERAMFGADGLSFGDLLDVVNPLHHVPVVSTVYELVTSDEIAAGPKLAGGRLFGGWIGVGASAIDVAVEQLSGKSVGEHVTSFFSPNQGVGRDGAPPEWVARLRSVFGIEENSRLANVDDRPSPMVREPAVVASTLNDAGPPPARPAERARVGGDRDDAVELRTQLQTHRRRVLAQRNASYLAQLPFDVGSDRSSNDWVL